MTENAICGLNEDGEGAYSAVGINSLCERLKGSGVTSLKCAASVRFHVSAH